MASIWKLNGADIYVDEFAGKVDSQIAEINPINSTASIFHKIFERTKEITLVGTVVGTTYLNTILATNGESVTLISDLVGGGYTILVQNVNYVRQLLSCQTIDQTQPTNAPVYRVTVLFRPQ